MVIKAKAFLYGTMGWRMTIDEFRATLLLDYAVTLRGYKDRMDHQRLLMAWQTRHLSSMWLERPLEMQDLVPDLMLSPERLHETPEQERDRIQAKFASLFPGMIGEKENG